MNDIQIEDCKRICALPFIDWRRLENKCILITGGTGLIGSNLIYALLYINYIKKLGLKLILPVRNKEAAKKKFGKKSQVIQYRLYSLGEQFEIEERIDYIVHMASPTSSKFFAEKPADTMALNIHGTQAMLELAREKRIEKFVYLSTMEVYGFPEVGHRVKENELGAFETMSARNSYPIAKIACEALCNSYYVQHDIPTVILRLTQTFGPGVKYDDGRVFAQFMRCVVEKKDIVLKSAGLTERPYLYTADAVSAIIVGLLEGTPGEAYTVANPNTYCSIKDMARMVADKIVGGTINVTFDLTSDLSKFGYADTLYMNLNIDKIKKIGWYPFTGLQEMFERMIKTVEKEHCVEE